MKLGKTSVYLFAFSLAFYLAAYLAGGFSRKYEIETADTRFGLAPTDLNYWDYISIAFIVLATSLIISAIWLRKRK
jgi:hypothetical protein